VLEGVGQGLLDGIEATGVRADEIVLVGGGSRNDYWAQMLADIANRPLVRREGGDFGPALGAARLARLGIDGGATAESCPVPPSLGEFLPDPQRHERHARRRQEFHRLYQQLEPLYSTE
jgi:xylulokinase